MDNITSSGITPPTISGITYTNVANVLGQLLQVTGHTQ